eukprot:NODE_32166_length_382_cov_0.980392.p4 GENE.NODE_32166_length_382_cov_0.980392~~NODE_32166_length_382_cov_0.980392.p4  ORF type:complete len:52 (-),score=11.27 NODE_32166_length_382_cov_0.980392:28-183(-)
MAPVEKEKKKKKKKKKLSVETVSYKKHKTPTKSREIHKRVVADEKQNRVQH